MAFASVFRVILVVAVLALPACGFAPRSYAINHDRNLRSTASIRKLKSPLTDDEKVALQVQFDALKEKEREQQEEREALKQRMWEVQRQSNAVTGPSAADRELAAELFTEERNELVADALFISALGLCLAWGVGSVAGSLSYAIGALIGTGYLVLLAQYTASFDTDGGGAAGGRFALVFFLVFLAAKNKDTLEFFPMLIGFFTYQLAALVQAFKAIAKTNNIA